MIRLALAIFILATPSAAQDALATQFNGYSVTISAPTIDAKAPSEAATSKAKEICGSVGKDAVFESSFMAQQFRAQFFFTCR